MTCISAEVYDTFLISFMTQFCVMMRCGSVERRDAFVTHISVMTCIVVFISLVCVCHVCGEKRPCHYTRLCPKPFIVMLCATIVTHNDQHLDVVVMMMLRRRGGGGRRRRIGGRGGRRITLTLPMLRLLSSKAQTRKYFWKPSKPCHVGIHWIALGEYSQMSTHVSGFQSSSSYFASFCIAQISHQQHKG